MYQVGQNAIYPIEKRNDSKNSNADGCKDNQTLQKKF